MRSGLILLITLLLGSATSLQAAAPTLSSGVTLDRQSPYKTAQTITNVFANKGVYGKLQGDLPFDLYRFTADHTGSQSISLLLPANQPKEAQLAAVLVDPTNATKPEQLGLPTPDATYHLSLIQGSLSTPTVTDRALFQQYRLISQSHVQLEGGKTYYLWVIDPSRQATRYVIKLGDGATWSASDLFLSFGSWIRLQTDTYAGSSPFHATNSFAGLLILLLGLTALLGIFLIQQLFALLSNRQKAAGYLLIKLQPYSRIIIWLSLWLLLIGGVLLFVQTGLVGIPFILMLLFILTVVLFLYETLRLSPRLSGLEVNRQEAALPMGVRKAWFFTGFLEAITLVTSLVLLGIFLSNVIK